MPEWNVQLTDFQDDFVHQTSRYPAYVASWATGKTMCGILKACKLSQMYPGNKGLVLRKNFTDLKDSTMSDFTDYTHNEYPIKAQSKTATVKNGSLPKSQILFHHADELAGVIQNINLGWFFIEQGEEFDTDEVFEKLGGRLRRVLTPRPEVQQQLVDSGHLEKIVQDFRDLSYEDRLRAESAIVTVLNQPLRQGYVIANTKGHNWIWRKWKQRGKGYMCDQPFTAESHETGKVYSFGKYASLTEAKTADNRENIAADFYAALMAKKETAPATFRRFVLNSWDDADTDDMCIKYTDILEAVDRDLRDYGNDIIVLSADPAEHGNDKFMIYVLKGYKVIDEECMKKQELMASVGHIVVKHGEHHPDVIVIDDVGVGAGPRSRLRELSNEGVISSYVMPINFGSSPKDKVHFSKCRDEVIMFAASLFAEGRVSIPNDPDLIEELASFTYEPNSKGQVTVHKKKVIKEKLGRSPDKADTLFMGLWAAKYAPRRQLAHVGSRGDVNDDYDYLRGGL